CLRRSVWTRGGYGADSLARLRRAVRRTSPKKRGLRRSEFARAPVRSAQAIPEREILAEIVVVVKVMDRVMRGVIDDASAQEAHAVVNRGGPDRREDSRDQI